MRGARWSPHGSGSISNIIPPCEDCPQGVTNGLEYLDKAIEEDNDILITSPITYVGNNRTSKNSRYLYALAFDLDGVGMPQLRDLLYQMMNDVIPTANIIVNSGNGLHLYYILKKPVALFQNAKEILGRLKRSLTTKLWNYYTSTIDKPQYQGIFQGFRIPGSKTKRGEVIPAFLNREAPSYSIEDLAKRVNFDPKKPVVSESEWTMLDTGKYTTDRLTLRKAKEKFPEWYERVIIKGDKSKDRWHISRNLYDWWLRTIKDPTSDVTTGHRYFCLLVLSMFAIKCDVPKEELEKDLLSMVEPFDRLSDSEDNPFTEDDALDALQAYNDDYCTFPRNSIEYLTGIRIEPNKRNRRPQNIHLVLARVQQEALCKIEERDWREGNGRPKGSIVTAENSPQYAKVQEWRKNNPNSSNKSLCARETGLSRPTVRKWWGYEG